MEGLTHSIINGQRLSHHNNVSLALTSSAPNQHQTSTPSDAPPPPPAPPPAPSLPTPYHVVSPLHLSTPPHNRKTYKKKHPQPPPSPTPFTLPREGSSEQRTAAADHPVATSPPQDASPTPSTTNIPHPHVRRFFPNFLLLPASS